MAKSKGRDKDRAKSSKKRRREKEERSPSVERRRKHRKSSNKSKSKDEDSRHKRRRSRGEDKKKIKERNESGGGEEFSKHGVQAEIQISEKDYFTRAVEFKVWLQHKKKKYFEDLTSAESHGLFEKFVKDWNRGKLDPHFYEGRLPEELKARAKKTQHKWGFVNKLTDRDQMQLELANDSVHSSTEKVKGVTSNVPVLAAGQASTAPKGGEGCGRGGGDGGGEDGDGEGDRGRVDRRTEAKRQRRHEREKQAVILDEIAPKETGHLAIAEKRREVGARTHAAAKAREDAADGLDMKESETMGGSDGFQEALARAKHGRERRQAAKTEHLQGLAAKEEEKRLAFMAQMGLKPGQKIIIQPRRDA